MRTIREAHPDSLIFVSGVDWAFNLRGMPLEIETGSSETFPNIVYSTHIYPWMRWPWMSCWPWMSRWHWKERLDWWWAFGHLAGRVPLFAGEWGGEAGHLKWGAKLSAYLRKLEAGWTAWSWADWPRLVHHAQNGEYTPTEFGALVRRSVSGADE